MTTQRTLSKTEERLPKNHSSEKHRAPEILIGNVFKQLITVIIFKYFPNMGKYAQVMTTFCEARVALTFKPEK